MELSINVLLFSAGKNNLMYLAPSKSITTFFLSMSVFSLLSCVCWLKSTKHSHFGIFWLQLFTIERSHKKNVQSIIPTKVRVNPAT